MTRDGEVEEEGERKGVGEKENEGGRGVGPHDSGVPRAWSMYRRPCMYSLLRSNWINGRMA